MEGNKNEVLVNVDELQKAVSEECCIFRVPKSMKEFNEKAFTPRVVSIGPYHHGKEDLRSMEIRKQRYLQYFLQKNKLNSMKKLFDFVATNEKKLRNCYAETNDLSSDEFVEMVSLDAAFTIAYFQGLNDGELNESIRVLMDIRSDLCMVENQIPFFVLEHFCKMCNDLSLIKLAMVLNQHLLSSNWTKEKEKRIFCNRNNVRHLLDFVRIWNEPQELHPKGELKAPTTPTVTELHQAGVIIKPRQDLTIFDIKFSNGILEIPPFDLDNATEVLLQNLLALEQFYGVEGNYFNDYMAFMHLISTSPRDTELLIQKGIIQNWSYHTECVSTLFGRLAKTYIICSKDFYYSELIDELNAYTQRPFHKWKATLKQDYFGNPWSAISFFAAGMALSLALIQTVCSIMQV